MKAVTELILLLKAHREELLV